MYSPTKYRNEEIFGCRLERDRHVQQRVRAAYSWHLVFSNSDLLANASAGVGISLFSNLGPDLQTILRQSYDYLTIMPKLRSTYDGRLIYRISYKEWKAFYRYDSHAKC